METSHSTAQMVISGPQDGSRSVSILKMLLMLAEARQASVNEPTLNLYVKKLAAWPFDSVEYACNKLATTPRREGETAFPALGDLFETMKTHRAKKAQEKADRLQSEERERIFWDYVDDQKKTLGMSEQEVLDTIMVPGYRGRKARSRS